MKRQFCKILLAVSFLFLVPAFCMSQNLKGIWKLVQSDVVNMAMKALSYSEIDAINHIITRLKELSAEKNAGFRKENNECEGVVIASKIADHVGVTRSVIVNALRKLESAGIIESRSLGMKGTFIKVLSPLFVDELASKFKRTE